MFCAPRPPNIESLMVHPPPPNLKVALRSLYNTVFSELLKVSKYYNQCNFLLYCIIGFRNYQSFHYRTHGPGHMASRTVQSQPLNFVHQDFCLQLFPLRFSDTFRLCHVAQDLTCLIQLCK